MVMVVVMVEAAQATVEVHWLFFCLLRVVA